MACDVGPPTALFRKPTERRIVQRVDATMIYILIGVMLFIVVGGPIFGADSRPGFRHVNRKPRSTVGSMRPEDWPPSEFGR